MQKMTPWIAIGGLLIAVIALYVAFGKAPKASEGKIYQEIADPTVTAKK